MSVHEVTTGDPAADLLLRQCARIIEVHEHLRMDTDEDEALRLRVVETATTALFDAAQRFADGLPEVECPGCGATIRARMSDTTPDDLRQVRACAYADGVLAGRAGITDTRLPGSNDDEEAP